MDTERENGLNKVAQYLFDDNLFDDGHDQEVEVEPEVVLDLSDSCTDGKS